MKIKYIKAKSFLSIGLTPIEIDFTKLGNIINIRGHNYDRRAGSSNGSGKSSILEVIVYGLYGKLLKKMSHKEAINTKIKKGLEVEIHFELNGHEYKITRTRKPDSLDLWKDGVKVSVGGQPATQTEIEKAVGLTYEAFVNIAFFGQHNKYSFLSCDAATKRQIVENLLSLERYNDYCQKVKTKRKEVEDEIRQLIKDYENANRIVEQAEKRLHQLKQQQQQWRLMRDSELKSLQKELVAKKEEIKNTDHGHAILKYQEAQESLAKTKEELASNLKMSDIVKTRTEEYREKVAAKKSEKHGIELRVATTNSMIQGYVTKIAQSKEALEPLRNLKDGESCPLCHGVVGKDNYHHITEHHETEITKNKAAMERLYNELASLRSETSKIDESIIKQNGLFNQCVVKSNQIRDIIAKLETRKANLETIKEPTPGLQETILKQKLDHITNMITAKETEIAAGDPYQDMHKSTEQEITSSQLTASTIKDDIKTKESKLPYYDYWIKGFGDKGIRSLIIDSIIPALNTRVNYWLQFLIDNQIRLNFDNNLEETIESNPPDGDPFVYNGLSGGEHLRIDLAISQAFAYLMMFSSGTCPSIVALDEVVTYQDRPGVHCIYSMICELARDRQVIVISHDQDLLQTMDGCDTITVIRKDGFSTANVVSVN